MKFRAQAPVRRDDVPRGIAYMIGATALFAAVSVISKWEVGLYPTGEVVFVRSLVALVASSLVILPRTGFAVFRTERLRDHILRGFSQSCSQTFIVVAFKLMPLAGAVAISFSTPLFATLLSALVLKEAVGVHRWSALIVGFAGVLLVTEPGAATFGLGSAFALANAVLYASVTVGVRRMTATESADTLTMYQMVLITAFLALLLPLGFVMPSAFDAFLLALGGVANALGQYWWTRSLHLAAASAVMPYYYLSLVWALLFGFVIWGDVPTAALLAGSGVVAASGLYLLWRESVRQRARRASPTRGEGALTRNGRPTDR
jgi:drug/metabolite transporter (DMT)-like permease